MRCSPLLASVPSTFLSDFFLMIIFICGTSLHHFTKNQTQTQTFLWVPCATRGDRHSWLSFYWVLQADCLAYSSVCVWRNIFWCNFWNIFFQAMHISQDLKLAPYVNHRSSPSYFLPSGTCTTLQLRVTVSPTELPEQVVVAAPILQTALQGLEDLLRNW